MEKSIKLLTWKEVVQKVLPMGGIIPRDFSSLITLCRQKGIGQQISYQKTAYTENDFNNILKIIKWWLLVDNVSNTEWRDNYTSKQLQERIIDTVKNDDTLTIFCIFCPSYKIGRDVYGYNKKIGDHTKGLIESFSRFIKESILLGIRVNPVAYFSDLILENYEKLSQSDKTDLMINYKSFCDEFLEQSAGVVKTPLLSSIKECETYISERGVKSNNIVLNPDIYNRVLERNIAFYKEKLMWEDLAIRERTDVLWGSYIKLAEIFSRKYPKGIMFWGESSYERGLVYSINQGHMIPIIYPKK